MTDYERMKAKITEIENMEYPELYAMFTGFFPGAACPPHPRTIKNRLIYKVQEMHLGGISKEDMQVLIEVSGQKNINTKSGDQPNPLVASVVHYVREWKGKKYDVAVISEKCFELDGVRYKSLSAAARAITGTRWNGKIFFGVKK